MFATINGARLYFDVEGSGLVAEGPVMREKPTVVLVHGGPGADHTVYKPDYSCLSDVAQLVYYDHRGNGRSDLCDESTWTLDHWADDLRGLCDHLGIEKPIVVGVSFGGFVAQAYAARHPGHAGKLALISTGAKVDFPTIYRAFGALAGPEAEAVAKAYWEAPTDESRAAYRDICVPYYSAKGAIDPDWLSRMIIRNETALWFNGPQGEQGRMDFRAALGSVDCPVLVMSGDKDPIMPRAFSEEIADCLPAHQCETCWVPDAGHTLSMDQPELYFNRLRAFIEA